MLKAGLLPAPVITPNRCDSIGTRLHIDQNTYIEIRCDAPNTKIFFTVDGTKPGPFQKGRGKTSTIKYIGAFRLQPGSRVIKAIAVSRDMLRESSVTTKFIEVSEKLERRYSNSNDDIQTFNDFDDIEYLDPPVASHVSRYQTNRDSFRQPNFLNGSNPDLQGSIEGPINPTNYAGTQINIWGFPPSDIGALIDPYSTSRSNTGFMTEQMINRLNTPRYPEPNQVNGGQPIQAIEYNNDLQSFKAFCKQLEKIYDKDDKLKSDIDTVVELASLKSANVVDKNDSFSVILNWSKFKPTKPVNKKPLKSPSPPPREKTSTPPPSPKIIKKPEVRTEVIKKEPPPVKVEKPEEPVIYKEELQQQGTLVPAPNFNAELDCEALKYAVKGLGTKENIIVEIMGNRSNQQRMQIKDMYKTMFGKELVDDLKGDTSGNFKKLLVNLLMTPVEYDCMELKKSMQGLGTSDSVLIEVLTSRSNSRLKEINSLYQKLFKRKLEEDVSSDTSGYYRKLLISLTTANRPETNEVDMNRVKKDVDDLIAAGIKKWGTDESKFGEIFGIRSYAHLRAVFEEYQRKTGKDIENTIKSEMSGNLAKTYLALIANIRNRPAYFAKEIKKAIKGLGTNEHTLNRIFISRCDVDFIQIKQEYSKLYNASLEKEVNEDVSGDYGKLLLQLAKDPSQRTYDPIDFGKKSDLVVAPPGPHEVVQVEEPKIEETPTVTAIENFDANDDCERLRKAMKGFGTDEKAIIGIVCKRSNSQRLELKTVYKQMFGKDLVKELDSELSGHFRDMILGLMMSSAEFDAWAFRKAIKGVGTDEDALIELLTTRTNQQINDAKEAFKALYNKNLEDEIKGDTSGDFRKVLVSLLTANRPSGNMVDKTQADVDAQNLINAGVKKLGTDESRFIVILCSRSYPQLRATFEAYQKRTGKRLLDDIKSEFSGDLKTTFISIVQCIQDKQAQFVNLLYKSMKGLGTNENCIVRILISRCEVDMVQIKQKFQELYKQSLAQFLKDDISGDFLRASLTLIGEESLIKK